MIVMHLGISDRGRWRSAYNSDLWEQVWEAVGT